MRLRMSIVTDRTPELFRSFMPHRKAIPYQATDDIICMQVYTDFKAFTPDTPYEKWAAVEVSDWNGPIEGMSTYTLPGGIYAVFNYRGRAADFASFFQYIFAEWLPQSGYEVDERPHFDLLGEKYKNNDPASEEEIWVPVRHRV